MISHLSQMLDPGALAIVLAGTMLATAARCGTRDLRLAGSAALRLGQDTFDEDENRVALARTVHEIKANGLLCAEASLPPDPSLARVVSAYLRHASLEAMHSARRAERAEREASRGAAVRTFEYAGDLAPVFGLVGTLFAITQLAPGNGSIVEGTMAALATAVLSTLYGVLAAHIFCIPMARAIERRGEREELAREQLIDWLDRHLSDPSPAPPARLRDAA